MPRPRGRPRKIINQDFSKNMDESMKESTVVEVDAVQGSKKVISPLTVDCGREDLNAIVAKVNEIIHAFNEIR